MKLNAVILNDTRGDNHFGCYRVMRLMEENLRGRGITITATSLVRNRWHRDKSFLKHMSEADLIIINGEGTLHHGASSGERLLKVTEHPARRNTPVALINAIYQENPGEWRRYLDKIDLICVRDSWSAKEIKDQTGRDVAFVPDLSLSDQKRLDTGETNRDMLLIGDSVSRGVTRTLLDIAASQKDAYLVPITKTIKSSKPHFSPAPRLLREIYIRAHTEFFKLRHPNSIFNTTEEGFIDTIRRGYLHVTGRFHSVCFCLFTHTPFLAVESNSWKIRALLEDTGMGRGRLVSADELKHHLLDRSSNAFNDQETASINAALESCRTKSSQLFDAISRLPNAN